MAQSVNLSGKIIFIFRKFTENYCMQYQTCPCGRDHYKEVERSASGKLGSKEVGWIRLPIEVMHKQKLWVTE